MDQLNAVKLNRFTIDLEYNSVLTVYCNIFEASILMACRFVIIVVKLFEVINSEFLINQIFRIASLVLCTVRRLSGVTGKFNYCMKQIQMYYITFQFFVTKLHYHSE